MDRLLFTLLVVFALIAFPAKVMAVDVTSQPICFTIRNTAPFTVYGNVETDYTPTDTGSRARHRSNFQLEPRMSEDFCTTGPFYPGRKLRLVLRTMFPVFSCYTQLDRGPIIIKGERGDGVDTQTRMWAECFE